MKRPYWQGHRAVGGHLCTVDTCLVFFYFPQNTELITLKSRPNKLPLLGRTQILAYKESQRTETLAC